jgi:serine/threonine protein kinase
MSKLEQEGKYGEMGGYSQQLQLESIIPGGRYRLEQLLYQRPRLNLYLGRRISPSHHDTQRAGEDGPLLAIRELLLAGLSPQVHMQIVRAAREEFISSVVPGIYRFPGTADRVFVEGERHYLVMQLGKARSKQSRKVMMLSELLCRPRWPWWLDIATALSWSIQLGRTVARLHRLGGIVGDLNLDTILVDTSRAARTPMLLVSWPPPPRCWPDSPAGPSTYEQYTRVFPIADVPAGNPFAAPEVIDGVYDVRSDVYSLGALLYLLCTHFAPSAAVRRQHTASINEYVDPLPVGASLPLIPPGQGQALPLPYDGQVYPSASLPLIPPRLLNSRLSPALEEILFRTLAFDPAERYPSAFALVEALEALP